MLGLSGQGLQGKHGPPCLLETMCSEASERITGLCSDYKSQSEGEETEAHGTEVLANVTD